MKTIFFFRLQSALCTLTSFYKLTNNILFYKVNLISVTFQRSQFNLGQKKSTTVLNFIHLSLCFAEHIP